ncbi:hypothetical protein LINGRAHAP2_LOCUS25909 [Linum grandiflorum]
MTILRNLCFGLPAHVISELIVTTKKISPRLEHPDHQRANLVSQFKELLRRSWEVQLLYIFPECKCLADYLASRGHGLPLGTCSVNVSDSTVATWIAYYRLRSSQPRLVFIRFCVFF